jgi:outer membrane receptor for ferrienterochelin and colicins
MRFLIFIFLILNSTVLFGQKIDLGEVVVSGSMREMQKTDAALPIERYSMKYFERSRPQNLLDATNQIVGLRPQVNCSVCNTGDIHLNGMEGAYTAVLIDGMPIVSSLSTVYGLSGIPLNMIERVEVIKGPASALYGSEAMAGIINVITKKPSSTGSVVLESSLSSMFEWNNDIAFSVKSGNRWTNYSAINYFKFDNPTDVNHDNFTDLALQERVSVFSKWRYAGTRNSIQLASRYYQESRWGGEMNWEPRWRGSDSVYGESIKTNRYELLAEAKTKLLLPLTWQASWVGHQQKSVYGNMVFDALQNNGFLQSIYQTDKGKHALMAGISLRYGFYDDNTVITREASDSTKTTAQQDFRFAVFLQDDWQFAKQWKTMLSARTDISSAHGVIISPRLALLYKPNSMHQLRLGLARGFREVNVFTEDHAALSGDRKVVFAEALRPETSINAFLSYDLMTINKIGFVKWEWNLFYAYFFDRIIADYASNANQIVYANLNGHATSRGLNMKADFQTDKNWNALIGLTILDAFEYDAQSKQRQQLLFSSLFSGNAQFSYTFGASGFKADYSMNVYSPMPLPVLPNDYRPSSSPWYALHNVQMNRAFKWGEIYLAAKNIFNFLPTDPLMRPFDPFDKSINVNNPNGYTFDTTYGYAPMQGRRLLIGIKWELN